MKKLKERILRLSTKYQEGHIPAAFSILDILWVLYDKVLGDGKFILSKGHAAIGLYAVMEEKGLVKIDSFGTFDSSFGGHPDRTKISIQASTGSLGHGFPMAVGLAIALKIKKDHRKVYVLIGDGESTEGTVWESAILASHFKLDNLLCIVDQNHSSAIDLKEMVKRFESFGWEAEKINGHDHTSIENALLLKLTKPRVIICETIKGNGIKIMENNPEWTHKYPSNEQLEEMVKEL